MKFVMNFRVAMIAPSHGASASAVSKNQIVIVFFVRGGFHELTLKTQRGFDNRTNGTSKRNSNP